jgi:hypothetical protein
MSSEVMNGLVGGPSVRKMKTENIPRSAAWVASWNPRCGMREVHTRSATPRA